MAAPTTLTVSTILECAKLAQGYAAMDRATKNTLYNGLINNLMPEKIYLVRKPIQHRYDIDPTDPTLVPYSAYLWSLLEVYGLRALNALGQGGGEVIVIPTGSAGTVITISGQIVELVVGDASQANPAGSPTPNDGDTVVTLNYKVMPSTENIFMEGVPVNLYSPTATDNYYIPIYGSSTTTYTFRDPLTADFRLKFDFMKIVGTSSGGISTGLQATVVNVITSGSSITVPELGTFVSLSYNGGSYYAPTVTQSGQTLDLSQLGNDFNGETLIVFYYP